MKTLILSDETYERLIDIEEVEQLLSPPSFEPELPSERDMRYMARRGSSEVPSVFTRAVAYRDAARVAADDTRKELERLIRLASDAGVGPAVLARWAALKPRRIYDILNGSRSEP